MSLLQKKEQLKTATPFQAFLTNFLAAETLQSVCPCVAAFSSYDIPAPKSAPLDTPASSQQYTYRPNLPVVSTKHLSSFIYVNQDQNAVHRIFGLQPGFVWETLDCCGSDVSAAEGENPDEAADTTLNTQVTICLLHHKLYTNAECMLGVLGRALQLGLDVCGLRLLYPVAELIHSATGLSGLSSIILDNAIRVDPIVALALRGASAHNAWLETVGPADPVLARRTDMKSLSAMYGGESRTECLIFVPRNALRIRQELARWFGGRVPPSGVVNVRGRVVGKAGTGKAAAAEKVADKNSNIVASEFDSAANTTVLATTLTASTHNDILLTISPLLPVNCLAHVLHICQSRDFQLQGIRRLHLTAKQMSALGEHKHRRNVDSV